MLLIFVAIAVLLPVGGSAADGSGDRIYWGAEIGGAVRVGNPNGSGTPSSLFGDEGGPCGVAIDPAAGKIYWANFFSGGIRVANLDGTGSVSTLFDAEKTLLCGVSIDPAGGKIYWADFGSNLIRVGNLDGSGSASTLFAEAPESHPSGVAIDPANGRIYWTNQNSDEVRVGPLGGSSSGPPSTLFGPADAGDNPIGVALAGGNVYWAALTSGQIRIGNPDGTGATALFTGESGPGALTIDPGAGKIYWASFGSGGLRVGNLNGSGAATLFTGEEGPLFPVLLRAPVGAGSPTISGGAGLGDPLGCSAGAWASDLLGAFLFRAPRTFSYQWQRNGSDIPGASSSSFTFTEPGAYACSVTASNQAGGTAQTSASFNVSVLSIEKFYDANTNGQRDASETSITGWKVQVGTTSYLTPKSLKLDPGTYAVSESNPTQTNWRRTTASSVQASVTAATETTVGFGNVCLGGGGALGKGFWGNKNGQALVGADDLAALRNLNLRTANGSHFDPTSYSSLEAWLQKAGSTNMAYALSAQLAAMTLNVHNGKVDGARLIYAPGTTSANPAGFAAVNAVTAEANAELGLHSLTSTGNSFRAYQSALSDALLNANEKSTFVQASPCAFSFR